MIKKTLNFIKLVKQSKIYLMIFGLLCLLAKVLLVMVKTHAFGKI